MAHRPAGDRRRAHPPRHAPAVGRRPHDRRSRRRPRPHDGGAATPLGQAGARRRDGPAQRDVRAPRPPLVRLLRPPPDRAADVARDRRSAGRALLSRLRPHLLLPERPHGRLRNRRPLLLPVGARAHRSRHNAAARRARVQVLTRRASDAAGRAAAARRRRDGRGGEHRRRPRREGVRAGAGRGGEVRPPLRARVRPDAACEPAARDIRPAHVVRPAARPGGGTARRRAHGRPWRAHAGQLQRDLPLPRHARRPASLARNVDRTGPARDRGRRANLRGARRAGGGRRSPACERSRGGARAHPLRIGLLRIPPGTTRAAGNRPGHSGRADGRAHRPHRVGEDDADLARPALLRRDGRARPRRRRRRPRRDAGIASQRDRRHRPGPVSLLRHRPGEHRLRPRRHPGRGGRAGRAARAGARVHRAPAAGLRHRHRRARDHALRRAAPACRHRPCARGRPARPDPRRRHRIGGRDDRGAHPGGAAYGDGGTDDVDHRPPPVDDRARGRDRRPRRREDRGARHARRARRVEPGVPRDLRARAPRAAVRGRRGGDRRDGGSGVRVHQPGGHLMRERGAEVTDWSWRTTRRRFGTLWRLTRPYRGRTGLSVISLLTATLTALAPPYLAKVALDDAVHGHTGGRLELVVVIFVAAGLANWGMTYVETYFTGWVGERILADLRNQLFAHLQRLSLGFYERNRAGVIISRLTNDVEAIDQLVTDGVTTLVQSTLTLAGTAVLLFVLDWRLALATCTVIPLMSAGTFVFRRHSAQAYAAVRERLGLVTATLAEDI